MIRTEPASPAPPKVNMTNATKASITIFSNGLESQA
jgi:hypothetical protein